MEYTAGKRKRDNRPETQYKKAILWLFYRLQCPVGASIEDNEMREKYIALRQQIDDIVKNAAIEAGATDEEIRERERRHSDL